MIDVGAGGRGFREGLILLGIVRGGVGFMRFCWKRRGILQGNPRICWKGRGFCGGRGGGGIGRGVGGFGVEFFVFSGEELGKGLVLGLAPALAGDDGIFRDGARVLGEVPVPFAGVGLLGGLGVEDLLGAQEGGWGDGFLRGAFFEFGGELGTVGELVGEPGEGPGGGRMDGRLTVEGGTLKDGGVYRGEDEGVGDLEDERRGAGGEVGFEGEEIE
jgi:hypothetical protein